MTEKKFLKIGFGEFLELDQREFTFTLTKKQFYSEQQQLTQQFEIDKQQFEIAKEQFEFEKFTFQHELQQQRDILTQQQLIIDQQKQHLQQHLQSYIIPSSNNNDLSLLSESVQNKEQSQQSLSQHLITSPPSSIFTDLLEGMIDKSNNHLNHEIKHYYQLTKQLHNVVNHLKKKEKKIEQRDMKSQECFRRNHHIRHHLVCYLKFMKSRHDMIINTMKLNKRLMEDNDSLKNKFKKDTIPLCENQMIINQCAWEVRSKQNEVQYTHAMKKYDEKKVGKEPEMVEVRANVMFKLINLNKNMHDSYYHSNLHQPLLSELYNTPESTIFPLLVHFLKRDYDNGRIPELTDDLKLFFSTQDVDNGRWIQFHGPGKEVDGSTSDNPITIFSLLSPHTRGVFKSTDDCDRCELTRVKCKKQHKETDLNYELYHSSPLDIYTSRYQISIKWE